MAADGAPGPTAWASTQVSAAPVADAEGSGYCAQSHVGTVAVWGSNFQPGATVRIELLSGNLATVMDTKYATIDLNGNLLAQESPWTPYGLNLTYGYSGTVAVVVDEYYPYNQEIWFELSGVC